MHSVGSATADELRALAEECRQKASSLLVAADGLEAAAEGLDRYANKEPEIDPPPPGRLEQIRAFLRANGPTRRRDIIERCESRSARWQCT